MADGFIVEGRTDGMILGNVDGPTVSDNDGTIDGIIDG